MDNTRFAHNKDVARRARVKTGSARLKAAGGARGQYPVRAWQGCCAARGPRAARSRNNQIRPSQGGRRCTGNTRFAHNKDVARRARAKAGCARLKAAGGARRQYPVCS